MKRYDPKVTTQFAPMDDALDGKYVLFDDHQAALAELAREVLPHIERSNHQSLPQMDQDDVANFDALRTKLRALAAEKP